MVFRRATIVAIIGAFVLAALGWEVAGMIVDLLGIDELGLPARVGGVFLALSLGDAALARFSGHG